MEGRFPITGDPATVVGLGVVPGRKLASGRDADVYELSDSRVLRRYRVDGTGRVKVSEAEAEIMRYLRERGYPVPAVHAVSGPDMVMDRVDGSTMLTDLGKRPWMLWRHARTLALLHHRLHVIPAPDWLPAYAAHPVFTAPAAGDGLPPTVSAPTGGQETLLHLDLHPDNVILSRRGPVVIDWRNTRRGVGAIDVATTWLIMATSEVPDLGLKGRVIGLVRHLFVDAFVRHAGRAAAARQLPTVARYRLADRNLLPSERPAILALARRASATR